MNAIEKTDKVTRMTENLIHTLILFPYLSEIPSIKLVDKKCLAAARKLAHKRVLDHLRIHFGDDRFDGQTVLRRRINDGHVARMDKRHVECARNRCRR